MARARINFADRFRGPETIVPVVLVEGVPIILTPAGTVVTAAAVTSGTVDPLWWPGVGSLDVALPGVTHDPVRAWLDPGAVWETFKRADVVKGDVRVEALTFDVHDPGGAATAILSGPDARITTLLGGDITAAATSIPLASTSGVPSSGVAFIGREALIYDGVGAGALGLAAPPAARGAFGSRARAARLSATQPAVVTCSPSSAPWPRWWYGRMATVWLCRLDGATLYDPTCWFVGTVGPGVHRSGLRWQIPVDSVVETLSRKLRPVTFDLFGIVHAQGGTVRTPLTVDVVELGPTSSDGWHPDAASFLRDWNARATALGAPISAMQGDPFVARQGGLGSEGPAAFHASWNDPVNVYFNANTSGVAQWSARGPMPDTVLFLDGDVPIVAPGEAAKLPTLLSFSSGSATARYGFTAKTASGEELTARLDVVTTRGSLTYVTLGAVDAPDDELARIRATIITERTSARLSVIAEGPPIDALYAASLALDELDGGLHVEAIDWDRIARVFASVPMAVLPATRRYVFTGGDTLLTALSHEARLRGMSLCTRDGRVSVFRTGSFAETEGTVATVTDADVIDGMEPEVVDAPTPLATSVRFELPRGDVVQWVDATSQAEFGDGDEIECKALASIPAGFDVAMLGAAIQTAAQQLLGVVAQPYRSVRVTLSPRFLGLQEGDLVLFTHPRVPTRLGTIGVVAATCQVEEVRSEVFGGHARLSAGLRLQDVDLAGYAPAALVAAGGIAGAVVTVDTSTPFGATCFARAVRPDGSAATDPLDGFAVRDKVVLQQLNTRTPIAEEAFTIVALDATAGTVTLNASPTAPMVAAAAATYGCMLQFADWTASLTDRQRTFLFIADHAAQDLGSGDPPKRWAS